MDDLLQAARPAAVDPIDQGGFVFPIPVPQEPQGPQPQDSTEAKPAPQAEEVQTEAEQPQPDPEAFLRTPYRLGASHFLPCYSLHAYACLANFEIILLELNFTCERVCP